MRRIVLALLLALVSTLSVGTLAPALSHAQTYSVPVVSVSPNQVMVAGTATVAGSGFTRYNYAYVYWIRPDGTSNATYAYTDGNGSFSFTLGFAASHGTGTEYVGAYDYGTGRYSQYFPVTVTSNVPPPPVRQISISPNPVRSGSTAVITGTGFASNNYVYIQWTRPNHTSGNTYVYTTSTGTFSFTLGFEPANGCGNEVVQAYDYGSRSWSTPYSITVQC